MLKGNMAQHEDGFTAIEILVTLSVAGIFLLAFTQLFNAIITISITTIEESQGVKVLMGYNDEVRYSKGYQFVGLTSWHWEPGMRGATGSATPIHIRVERPLGVDISPTLERRDVAVFYNGDHVMRSSTFIRYSRGIFYREQ